MSWSTGKLCFQVSKRGEQNSFEKYSFSMWDSMSWPTRKLCFQVSKRGEQNITEKYSFSMWCSMSWPFAIVAFQLRRMLNKKFVAHIRWCCYLDICERFHNCAFILIKYVNGSLYVNVMTIGVKPMNYNFCANPSYSVVVIYNYSHWGSYWSTELI
jgi:hypothetical protein